MAVWVHHGNGTERKIFKKSSMWGGLGCHSASEFTCKLISFGVEAIWMEGSWVPMGKKKNRNPNLCYGNNQTEPRERSELFSRLYGTEVRAWLLGPTSSWICLPDCLWALNYIGVGFWEFGIWGAAQWASWQSTVDSIEGSSPFRKGIQIQISHFQVSRSPSDYKLWEWSSITCSMLSEIWNVKLIQLVQVLFYPPPHLMNLVMERACKWTNLQTSTLIIGTFSSVPKWSSSSS